MTCVIEGMKYSVKFSDMSGFGSTVYEIRLCWLGEGCKHRINVEWSECGRSMDECTGNIFIVKVPLQNPSSSCLLASSEW